MKFNRDCGLARKQASTYERNAATIAIAALCTSIQMDYNSITEIADRALQLASNSVRERSLLIADKANPSSEPQ